METSLQILVHIARKRHDHTNFDCLQNQRECSAQCQCRKSHCGSSCHSLQRHVLSQGLELQIHGPIQKCIIALLCLWYWCLCLISGFRKRPCILSFKAASDNSAIQRLCAQPWLWWQGFMDKRRLWLSSHKAEVPCDLDSDSESRESLQCQLLSIWMAYWRRPRHIIIAPTQYEQVSVQ